MLHVEDKGHKLGLFTEVNRQKLIDQGIVLKALPARSPKVKVMDAYLKPLRGVKVYAKATYGLKSVETSVGVTNSAGEIRVPAVYHGGEYTFRAALLGYSPAGSQTPPVGSASWIDMVEIVTEPATDTVKGKVVDGHGKPVPGAKVTTNFGPNALTDTEGKFTLKQMPDSPVKMEARKGKLVGTNLDAKGRLISASEPIVIR